jgi:type VI secretion system secreted protein VgrG
MKKPLTSWSSATPKSAHKPEPGYESIRFLPVAGDETSTPDTLSDWNERVSSVSQASVTLRSFDFTKPQDPVEAVSQGAGQHLGDALEVYEYLGDFTDKSEGEARGQARLAASRAPRRLYSGGGDVLGLACGRLFTLTEAGVDRFNQEYLIIGLNHVVEAESHRSGDDRQARRVNVDGHPQRHAVPAAAGRHKPISSGVETATVTGPSRRSGLCRRMGAREGALPLGSLARPARKDLLLDAGVAPLGGRGLRQCRPAARRDRRSSSIS